MIAKILFAGGFILYAAPLVGLGMTAMRMLQAFHGATLGDSNAAQLSAGISYSLEPLEAGMALMLLGALALFAAHILRFRKVATDSEETSRCGFVSTSLLCTFFGFLGAHRFYVQRNRTGFFFLLTLGGFLVGKYVDYIQICRGKFKDSDGRIVRYRG